MTKPASLLLLGACVFISSSACGPTATTSAAGSAWVGTITTEGNVTTVVTESGSVWGGTARLVEEASIGVESGRDEYMLGNLMTVTADGERILIVDEQADAVRTYDHSGEFLRNLGSIGQGPGEFTMPMVASIDEDGRAYVLDVQNRRVNVYTPDGNPAETWANIMSACCAWPMYPRGQGTLWMPIEEFNRETRERRNGVQAYGSEGALGAVLWVPEIDFEPIQYTFNGRELSVPLGPRLRWGPTPTGGVFVGGTDRYRFEVHEPDGSTLVVEKYSEPVPYPPAQIDWTRRLTVARLQGQLPGWSWNGAEIPTHKPAFSTIVPVMSGGYWVRREGVSHKVPDCTEDPMAAGIVGEAPVKQCWDSEWALDAFDKTGRYLGEIEMPEVIGPFQLGLFVDGDVVVTGAQDDEGIYRVKRYRLVLPGEEAQ